MCLRYTACACGAGSYIQTSWLMRCSNYLMGSAIDRHFLNSRVINACVRRFNSMYTFSAAFEGYLEKVTEASRCAHANYHITDTSLLSSVRWYVLHSSRGKNRTQLDPHGLDNHCRSIQSALLKIFCLKITWKTLGPHWGIWCSHS